MSDVVLNPPTAAHEPGFYGKMPARGDFIARRLDPKFLKPLDEWLQRSIATSQRQLKDFWLTAYLDTPIWRFVMGPGLCGDIPVAGVLMPSVDRVGRYFPLVLAASLPGCSAPVRLMRTADDWFGQIERLALSSLDDEFDFDRFDNAMRAIGLPAYESQLPTGSAERSGFRVDLADDPALTQAYSTILDQVLVGFDNRFSLWWTTGSERVRSSLLIAPGLPAPQNFAAFMDGKWDEWGWERPSASIPIDLDVPVLLLKPSIELPSFGRSHPGAKRTSNQDAYLLRPDLSLWAVADGVGGHQAGEFASRTVVDQLNQVLPPLSAGSFVDDVQAALGEANAKLREKAALLDENAIVASTVAILITYGNGFTCLWAGDSRIYLYRKGVLRLLTRDHVSQPAAAGSGKSAAITRAVGAAARLELDVVHDQFEPGDRFLLCSDGLSGVLKADELADALSVPATSATIDRLIEDALVSGAPDNVTAVVIEIPEGLRIKETDPGESGHGT
ncbi:hypothetical protein GCM10011611_27970 [Aliidongia dinghuensis]|uniref:PPM-type phosphatase domain-containing protein n=1 Tax=Aliidongia dinghuensis TaxID=1867774 RepID=A0A8J2YVE7_9PROT|nr:type VI secretion system-associated protein TagF [Aliidongia dinghuensis]GGF20369.1 hypothetical protein GCM10011611_27970 [Aliidongia dinghuensis]